MLMHSAPTRRQRGMSLIELMIAIVAGLIVIGAALAFTVSTVRAYGENIRSTKLSQELRTGMGLVVRELRRAGHDGAANHRVMTEAPTSLFRNVSTSNGCLTYEYDHGATFGNAATATEKRAIRYDSATGSLQMMASEAGADCNSGTGTWEPLTDPRVITVTAFAPQKYESPFCVVGFGHDTDGDGDKDRFDFTKGTVTSVSLCLKASLASDGSTVRWLTDTVRIRADNLVYGFRDTQADTEAECAAIAAPAAPPSPSELNTTCANL